ARVGRGNTGGEALFALAFRRARGVEAGAVPGRTGSDGTPVWHAEGWAALTAAGGRRAETLPGRADVVVDAMLGTGARGPFTLPDAARHLPEHAAVVACDVPSGVDADTGAVPGKTLPSERTVTFGALKTGLLLGEGARAAGRVHLVDIGLGPHLPTAPHTGLHRMDAATAETLHPRPDAGTHKYTRGLVGVAAGSARYPGAAVLTVGGALAGGAGMAHHAGHPAARALVLAAHPEALASEQGPAPERTAAWVLGPGLDADADARAALDRVRDAVVAHPGTPLVVDASALTLLTAEDLTAFRRAGARVLLTPHTGEWAGLRERLPVPAADAVTVTADGAGEIERLRAWTAAHGVSVLLKGPRTLVVAPDGEAWLMDDGGPELAVAGSGDVLAGVLGAVFAAEAARIQAPGTPLRNAPPGDIRSGDVQPGAVQTGGASGAAPGSGASRPSLAALAAAGAWWHARAGAWQARHGRARAGTLPEAVSRVLADAWWGTAGSGECEDGLL
ncbi:bifunctional ADP-dependent NAD(P)H-hydrate dehydratase/NAD(P)H-hydrate epimerase, partial [Micrococcus sp.]|uniref:bifunctional ADP-dependent NAD(P)H-hydrate dehydratase/NAD(P)H-hydrate epimerase n=1 Tax=Micrococcus sp. TaxID=1271 RepID=UPI002A91C184